MSKFITVVLAVLALVIGVLVFNLVSKPSTPEFALYYQQARVIKTFELTDHQGAPFNQQSLQGQWSWIFFGYTSCPDVCPTTLQEMNFVYDELKAIASNSQVLLVTVDPKRDTQEKLASYIHYFNPEFKALRGEHDVLFPFARNLGLMYAITYGNEATLGTTESSTSYLVDHSASLVLVNPAGKIAAIFKPRQELGHIPSIEGDKLVSDFAKIVDLY